MKHYKLNQTSLEDIKAYSLTMNDDNLRNIHDLFESKAAQIKPVQKSKRRSLKRVLAATMAAVMAFSAIMVVNADFREAVFGFFGLNAVEMVTENDQSFTNMLTEGQVVLSFSDNVAHVWNQSRFDEILAMENEDASLYSELIENEVLDTFYEYTDGRLKPLDATNFSETITYKGADFFVDFFHGVKSNGQLYVRNNNLGTDIYEDYPVVIVTAIPNRTDTVHIGLYLGETIYNVYFNLTTFKITDSPLPAIRTHYIIFSPDGTKAVSRNISCPYTGLGRYCTCSECSAPDKSVYYYMGEVYLTDLVTGKTTLLDINNNPNNPEIGLCDWIDNESFFYNTKDSLRRFNVVTGRDELYTALPLSTDWWLTRLSDNGRYMACLSQKDGEDNLHIIDMESGETNHIYESIIDEQTVWCIDWLNDNLLAVGLRGDNNISNLNSFFSNIYTYQIDD
ncbi:MAG: hypothetical protein FWF94_03560 [Oscillospiraceae bacterium]|nr:hypothetical protein [Oscillospiraceae bacterium]